MAPSRLRFCTKVPRVAAKAEVSSKAAVTVQVSNMSENRCATVILRRS